MQPRWNRQATPVGYREICQTPVLQGKQYGFDSSDLQITKEGMDRQCFIRRMASKNWSEDESGNRRILLFIDNCTAHVSVTGLTNTWLIFFPPNCTSRLQPADQGITQNLKVYYRQAMIRRMLQYLDEDQPIKAIDLKDATFMLAKAWDNVSPDTIQNCWRKAGFPGVVIEPT